MKSWRGMPRRSAIQPLDASPRRNSSMPTRSRIMAVACRWSLASRLANSSGISMLLMTTSANDREHGRLDLQRQGRIAFLVRNDPGRATVAPARTARLTAPVTTHDPVRRVGAALTVVVVRCADRPPRPQLDHPHARLDRLAGVLEAAPAGAVDLAAGWHENLLMQQLEGGRQVVEPPPAGAYHALVGQVA